MEKKEVFKQAHELVAENFFIFLSESGKTMKQYAEDNDIDRTTLSKWKNGVTSMTVDQIKTAAIYFGKTVNDFYYSNEEKKKLEVLTDKNYHPTMAQQSITINDYTKCFNNPFKFIYEQIYLLIILVVIACFLSLLTPWGIFFIVTYPFCLFYRINEKDNYYKKRTFVINYLDDIYYKIDDNKNRSYKYMVLMTILILTMLLVLTISQYFIAIKNTGNLKIYFYIFFGVSILFMVFMVNIFDGFGKELKKEIYDSEIQPYYIGFTIMSFGVLYLGMAIVAAILLLQTFYYIIFACLILIISILVFYFITKEFKRYFLCYDNGVEVVRLFSKKEVK